MSHTAIAPYERVRHDLGRSRNNQRVVLMPMTTAAADVLAPVIAAVGPWAHYGTSAATLHNGFLASSDGAARFTLLCNEAPAGAVIIRSPWLVGPYLQMLAILPSFQGGGVGAIVLDWYEQQARMARQRNVWLCVTGINTDAQRFYARHGYSLAGTLPDLLRAGDAELLMRKQL